MSATLRNASRSGKISLHSLRRRKWRATLRSQPQQLALRWLLAAGLVAWTAFESSAQAKPNCSLPAEHCFELVVHTVHQAGQPVVPVEWLTPRVAHANRLFAAVAVQFAVGERHSASARFADLQTREQRDALGRGRTSPGAIHVFIVQRLADVDVAGQVIRGVHWRQRPQTAGQPRGNHSGAEASAPGKALAKNSPRWIILSSIAPPLVLAHELGHYFGLPHSRDGRSLMNKQKGGGRPPWPTRNFLPKEHRRMQRQRDTMLRSGWLVALDKQQRLSPLCGQ